MTELDQPRLCQELEPFVGKTLVHVGVPAGAFPEGY